MKILFISSGGPTQDYMRDMTFHGLRVLLGPDAIDVGKLDSLYRGADLSNTYGKGFTLYGLLPDIEVDRTDIPAKLKARYFDLIIYGSIQRCHNYLGDVLEHYPPEQIVFIDGEDQPTYLTDCVSLGHYFKRELHNPQPSVYPIQFAIPEEKLQPPSEKVCLLASLHPLDSRTYIYDDEQSYYDSYRSALFARTMKKAGYDCLRHYEIMACNSIPYFANLEYVPATIMTNLPRKELLVAKTLLEYNQGKFFTTSSGFNFWLELNEKIQQTLRSSLTTVALAKTLLSTLGKESPCLNPPLPHPSLQA